MMLNTRCQHLISVLVTLCLCVFAVQDTPADRAAKLLKQMTSSEKFAMVHGYGGDYVGNVNAIDRLKIPALHLEDGPQGVADGVKNITCWPSALTIVASWDTELMHMWARALAQEQRIKGTNIMLGPMINIARVPMGGRNFESFGEDPHLASAMVRASVKGIQSHGIMACAKHYVDNNQEYHRFTVSANVDERTQWEIYYPAFQAAVDAGVASIMCSYNKINDTWACENEQTLNVDLKGRMGYQGFVMSDWGATHSTVLAANSGLDMQMPDDGYFGTKLQQAVKNGQVLQSRVDDMVLRILTSMFSVGIFDNPQTGNISANARSSKHDEMARFLSAAGTVLLKNDGDILPLQANTLKTIAVIGDDGNDKPIVAGGGSGYVQPPYIITPLQGIRSRAGSNVNVNYANSKSVSQAVKIAKAADVAIVFVATWSQEGTDRANLSLPYGADDLVTAVAQAQSNTIVVVHTQGSVLMPWASIVPAILCAFMPGQEDGNAIASVLFGDYNPSARLPVTFPVTQSQIPVNTPAQYPGINDEGSYSEKLLVGYRWYDEMGVQPLFPFGHGLSYTTFDYANLNISGNMRQGGIDVQVDVSNTGSKDGTEIVQIYLGYPESAGEPPKVLRRFERAHIKSGHSHTCSFTLHARDVSVWDVTQHDWSLVSGEFTVYVGASSRDIRIKGVFTV